MNSILGDNGFIWWIGVVEDRQDPIKLGRCKVRMFGRHSDKLSDLPTADLPWASPLLPVNNTSVYTVKEGDTVVGFFMDGENAKVPVIMGILPNIPVTATYGNQDGFHDQRTDLLNNAPRKPSSKEYKTDGSGIVISEDATAKTNPLITDEPVTSRIARNDAESIEATFIKERKDNIVTGVKTVTGSWDEPKTPYDTVYPYNRVMETESGHILEFDDTFGKERIHLAHRNGSFQEWFPDGDKVEKITKKNYQIVMSDDHLYVMGKCNITVQGDAELYVMKNAFAKIDGNVVGNVGGNVDLNIKGNFNADIGGTCDITSGGNMKLVAPRIDFNP